MTMPLARKRRKYLREKSFASFDERNVDRTRVTRDRESRNAPKWPIARCFSDLRDISTQKYLEIKNFVLFLFARYR